MAFLPASPRTVLALQFSMTRSWESKSVEQQQAEPVSAPDTLKPRHTPE
jgi:hypothetical protein